MWLAGASLGLTAFGMFSGISQARKQEKIQIAQIEAQTAMAAMNFKMNLAFIEGNKKIREGEKIVFELLLGQQKELTQQKHDFHMQSLRVNRTLFDIQEIYKLNLSLQKIEENTFSYANRGLSLSTGLQVYAKQAQRVRYEYNMQKLSKDIEMQYKRINLMFDKNAQDLHFVEKRVDMINNIARQELQDIRSISSAHSANMQAQMEGVGAKAQATADARGKTLHSVFTGLKSGIDTIYNYNVGKGLFGDL